MPLPRCEASTSPAAAHGHKWRWVGNDSAFSAMTPTAALFSKAMKPTGSFDSDVAKAVRSAKALPRPPGPYHAGHSSTNQEESSGTKSRYCASGEIVTTSAPSSAVSASGWRAWLHFASLLEERGDLPGYPLEFVDLAVVGDEVLEYSAAVEPFLLETPALALGCLARFLLGELAGTGLCLRFLLALALLLGLARGLGLQPAALGGGPLLLGRPRSGEPRLLGGPRGGEPRLLGSPLLPGGLFPGKLLGALPL